MSDPGGARTLDPLIKSQLLYQLSYGVIDATGVFPNCGAKLTLFFQLCKFFSTFFQKPPRKTCQMPSSLHLAGRTDVPEALTRMFLCIDSITKCKYLRSE